MNQQDKVQLIWAASFVISGIILGFAIWMIPVIGLLATSSFVVVYIGISAAFLFIFREIENVHRETLKTLKERHGELLDVKKAIEGKYYSRKIDQDAFKKFMQHYERKLTEIEVKIKRIEKSSNR